MNYLNLLVYKEEAKHDLFKDFLAISSWQSFLSTFIFFSLTFGLWYFLKKIKIKFVYRVLIGLFIGLIFGIAIQAINHFPNETMTDENNHQKFVWVYESSIWISFLKNIFMNGILLITGPVVFIALFRVTSKPGSTNLKRITIKGVALLLTNVVFAFLVTFALGYFLKVGDGTDIKATEDNNNYENHPLPQIIWNYVPSNFVGTWTKAAIIPLMVLGALIGSSVKILSKKKKEKMDALRSGMDTAWDLCISVLMTFMKIMPLAVMSMIASSIINRPISALESIGKIIGIGYLGIIISSIWLTFLIFISGIKVKNWWSSAWRPLLQGFTTQSSNATLPTTIDTLKNDMKIDDNVVSVVAPLSTSMGLMGCAGVQSGIITSFLWTGTSGDPVHSMSIITFIILSLLITVIASLGIAGIPGTASVVTAGVLGGLGFGAFYLPVTGYIAALDGLFDMGRTGLNVLSPVAVSTIVAKSEGLIDHDSNLLNKKAHAKQLKRKERKKLNKDLVKDEK